MTTHGCETPAPRPTDGRAPQLDDVARSVASWARQSAEIAPLDRPMWTNLEMMACMGGSARNRSAPRRRTRVGDGAYRRGSCRHGAVPARRERDRALTRCGRAARRTRPRSVRGQAASRWITAGGDVWKQVSGAHPRRDAAPGVRIRVPGKLWAGLMFQTYMLPPVENAPTDRVARALCDGGPESKIRFLCHAPSGARNRAETGPRCIPTARRTEARSGSS